MAKEQYVDYLLIGGGLACSRAVERIRHSDPKGKILLVAEESHMPYDRPPLSKGIITGTVRAKEIACAPRSYYRRNRVKVLRRRKVRLLELSGEYGLARLTDGRRIRFARALIGTGGRAKTLGLPGEELTGVHVLRTVDDALAIRKAALGRLSRGAAGSAKSHVAANNAEPTGEETHAVIVGCGFTGTELAASLASAGVRVSVVEARDRIWAEGAPVELRDFLRARLESLGVEVLTSETVANLNSGESSGASGGGGNRGRSGGAVESVTTDSAAMLQADMVCIAAGVVPNVKLAEHAGLTVDDGIVADEALRTSDPKVYAAGDVCRFTDPFSGRSRRVEHYGNAEYGGLLAGENMAASHTGRGSGGGAGASGASGAAADGAAAAGTTPGAATAEGTTPGAATADGTPAGATTAEAGGHSLRAFDYLTTLWSDIGDITVETGGDEQHHDEFIFRGTLPFDGPDRPGSEISWIAIGIAEGRVSCYYAVNASRADLSALQLLIRGKVPAEPARQKLADSSQRLSEVAHSLLRA